MWQDRPSAFGLTAFLFGEIFPGGAGFFLLWCGNRGEVRKLFVPIDFRAIPHVLLSETAR
jgi:hypothetical protein